MTEISKDDIPRWFILTHLEPKQIEERLKAENAQRFGSDFPLFEYFVPYQFLKRRVSRQAVNDDGTDTDYYNPRNREEVKANNETRAELRNFIFIKATNLEIEALIGSDWNRWVRNRLQFYRDRQRQRITVPDRMMSQFIDACCNYRDKFDLWPAIDDIEKNETVVLNSGPFMGEKAHILQVRHSNKGITLTVGIEMFSRTMTLRLHNVTPKDIVRQKENAAATLHQDPIEDAQRHLLAILSRKVYRKETDDTARKDAATLDRLYNYRHLVISNDAARRHFLALMLICAHLRHDNEGRRELTTQALHELEIINARGDQKAATDTRTYLWVALYVATGLPDYRNAAKAYVQQHSPKSQKLRRFVTLIRKRQKI